MPSKKQRRRREKLQRHEQEWVQLDADGNEIPLEPAEVKKAKPSPNGKPAATRARRPIRETKPPSWSRALKRAVIFVPFLYIFLSIGSHTPPWYTRVGISILYAVVFVPMFYFVDRMAYRAYLRRSAQT